MYNYISFIFSLFPKKVFKFFRQPDPGLSSIKPKMA